MESENEAIRLNMKTRSKSVEAQARWAGLTSGMRVADIGCGSGKCASILNQIAHPHGEVVGVDASGDRLAYARKHYRHPAIHYIQRNIYQPLVDLGQFDFIWSRFFLEYHKSGSAEIVRNLNQILRPGGTLCLIDLDYNCLSHYGLSERLNNTIKGIMHCLEWNHDFDPFTGRKLYSFLFDLGYQNIRVKIDAHHLIYGALSEIDAFNWTAKIEIAAKNSGFDFETEYAGGFSEFVSEYKSFFYDPRRFTYTPLIICCGIKPGE